MLHGKRKTFKRDDCKSKTRKWYCVHLALTWKSGSDMGNAPKSLDIGSVDSGCSEYLEGEQEAGGVGWHLRTTKITQVG